MRRRIVLRKFLRGLQPLVLMAALLGSLLPAGQMPKLAGPCGKALCECPIPACAALAYALHENSCHGKNPCARVATLQLNAQCSAAAPEAAFQLVLTGMDGAARTVVVPVFTAQPDELPQGDGFARIECPRGVFLPPPRL